jgi:hypothetical protein
MFKGFLMENAHRENVKNLFRWWNGHVFSFDTVPGTNRKDNDGFDSGMDEAEAALNSDGGFSDEGLLGGEIFGDDVDGDDVDGDDVDGTQAGRYHWPRQADNQPLALGMNTDSRPDDLSTNFVQLTISERSVAPLDPVAAPVQAIAVPWVREPTSVHSAGVASITIFTPFAQCHEYLTLLMIS